jgi:uncharacterized protein (UPF0333 family)
MLLLVSFVKVFSQETTADIQGVVNDEKGAGLQGATVVAVHQPTGTSYTTTTRKDGRYNLPNLRVGGPYTITVTFVGFSQEKQDNITLLLGQEFKADFVLKQQAQQLSEVVVSTNRQGKVFNSSHTGSQEIISRSQIERLPTLNRSLQDFTRLTPTANGSQTFNGLSFGGQLNQYNNITVDGANFNNSFGLSGVLGGQTSSQPISMDAIEQIQVNVSPYDVRQGGFSGAGINSVTRSGTNTLKGSVYTYIKTPGLQGYKVGPQTIGKQDYNYNLRGFSVGGPLIKNKLFFFVSGESERTSQPATTYIASDASHQPSQGTVSNADTGTLNTLSRFLMSTYGYNPGAYQGYNYRIQSDKITAKVDWNINRNNVLTLKYNYLKSFRDQQPSNSGSIYPNGGGRTPGFYGMPFSGSSYIINNNFNIFIAELNSRISNKMSNKLQVGYTALRDFRSSLSNGNFPLVDIADGNGHPLTSFGYEQYTYGNVLNTDVIQLNDIFTLYKGRHEITFGTQNSIKKFENGFSPSYEGVYQFNSVADFYASAAGTKAPAKYFLSYTMTKDGSFPLVGPKETDLGVFAQDKWRVNNNFTLTYGLRIDAPLYQNTFYYNPVVDTLTQFRNGQHVNTGQKPNTNILVSPRVGFNWDVTGDQKTQVRGGIGLFAGPPPFVWISNQASNSGVALFGSISSQNGLAPDGSAYYFSPDINKYRPSVTSSSLGSSYSINVTDPNFKYPQALKTTLAVDRRLPNDFVVTLEGNYTKNINSVFFENINLPSTGVAIANGSDNRIRYSGTKIYPLAGGSSVNNPSIGNAIYMTNANGGYAYTATLQVQKSFRNLNVNAAYTYTKAMDLMVGGSTASTMWGTRPVSGDPNSTELGYSEGYLPHRIIVSAFYRKEYAKNFATSVGLIYEAAPSGVGSYVYSGDLNNDGNSSNDLMYIPRNSSEIQLEQSATTSTGVVDPRTPAQIWAQLNNFINQDPYLSKHRGEVAQRNAAINPWFKRMDMNITQDLYITTKSKERHTLRFTLDIYNVGNLLNKNWGIYKSASTLSPLKYDKMAADGKTPIFSMPYADANNLIPYTSSFRDNTSTWSRWQMQFGIRYLFN